MPDRPRLGLVPAMVAAVLAGTASPARAQGPVIDRVPATVPATGFRITGCCDFMPPTLSQGLMSKHRALVLSRKYARAGLWRRPRFLLANVVGPIVIGIGTSRIRTIRNAPAWVVTFTADTPQQVAGPAKPVKHFSVVLEGRDGTFVRGFYTA